MSRRLCLCLLVGLLVGPVWAQGRLPRPSFSLSLKIDPIQGIAELSWQNPERQTPVSTSVLRSTTDLRVTKDGRAFPIAVLDASGSRDLFCDPNPPQDVDLSYQLKLTYPDGRTVYSTAVQAKFPAPKMASLSAPLIVIDKLSYTLTIVDGGRSVRRFPIALGADPANRKLHYDRASTPEGFYQISALQPKATFYRAFDLNYPNDVDTLRYRTLAESGDLPNPTPDIGGEIQIHGHGITGNWTWGCIALRDEDMDRLFSWSVIKPGTPVIITGAELTRDDLDSEQMLSLEERGELTDSLVAGGFTSGRSPRHWILGLCRFQARHGLLVTGLYDRATRRVMERQLGRNR